MQDKLRQENRFDQQVKEVSFAVLGQRISTCVGILTGFVIAFSGGIFPAQAQLEKIEQNPPAFTSSLGLRSGFKESGTHLDRYANNLSREIYKIDQKIIENKREQVSLKVELDIDQKRQEKLTGLIKRAAPVGVVPEWMLADITLAQLLEHQRTVLARWKEVERKLLPAHPYYQETLLDKQKSAKRIIKHLIVMKRTNKEQTGVVKRKLSASQMSVSRLQKQKKSLLEKLSRVGTSSVKISTSHPKAKFITQPRKTENHNSKLEKLNRPPELIVIADQLAWTKGRLSRMRYNYPAGHSKLIIMQDQVWRLEQELRIKTQLYQEQSGKTAPSISRKISGMRLRDSLSGR